MDLLLNYLKEKALNEKTKFKKVYDQSDIESVYLSMLLIDPIKNFRINDAINSYFNSYKTNTTYNYSELYQLVLDKIKHLKDNPHPDKTPYLMVINDAKSVANIIAYLYLGYSPILINAYNLFDKNKLGENYIIDQGNYLRENNIASNYIAFPLDLNKLDKIINKSKNSIVINEPGEGKIGIFSSGTLGNPKTIFIDEKDIINNVLKSKYNNRSRIIYNTTPISGISGLFTNVFMPLVIDDCEVYLRNSFNFNEAVNCTDVYLPRNYQELLPELELPKDIKIEKIFVFGEFNNYDLINNIRNVIPLKKNVFVHVYGCTECGGLVSEYEEKDFDELHVYYYSYENDFIIFSYNDEVFFKSVRGEISEISKETFKNYFDYKYPKLIPCGLVSEKNMHIANKTIGECIIGNHHTGDIAITLEDKIYILGRQNQLEKNHHVGCFDQELSVAADNRLCSTFTDENNKLCVAIKYPLDYDKDYEGNDKTSYFRRLIPIAKELDKKIRDRFKKNSIGDIIFVTDDKYQLSGGLKKTVRSSFEKLLDEGREINYRLEHFDEVLVKHINNVCKEKLGYIPEYHLDENKNIIFAKKTINLFNISNMLNELSIVLINEDDDNYIVYYDDAFFFDENKGKSYNKEELYTNQNLAIYDLLIEKLAADNNSYAKCLKDDIGILKEFKNMTVHYLKGKTDDDETIIIPFFCHSFKKEYEDCYNIAINVLNKYLEENFKDIDFEKEKTTIPLPTTKGSLLMLRKAIIIDEEGNIYTSKSEDEEDDELLDYICSVIAKKIDGSYQIYRPLLEKVEREIESKHKS